LRAERRYYLLRFKEMPSQEQVSGLRAEGVEVLRFVPDDAVLVSAPVGWVPDQAAATMEEFPSQVKLSPMLRPPAAGSVLLRFLAEFHPDVSPGEARSIALQEGLQLREHPDLAQGQIMLEGMREQMEALAAWDEVAYIFPASDELQEGRPAIPCAGAVTDFGPIGQYIQRIGEGWTGTRVGHIGILLRTADSPIAPGTGRNRDYPRIPGVVTPCSGRFCLPARRDESAPAH
jgi:hypothetical protein